MVCFLGWSFFLVPVALQFILNSSPTTAASRKCGSIYKGFAECLLKLGDSMTENVQQGAEDTQELDTVCRFWDEFHACVNAVLAGCPEEAAAVWESLRRESKKMQFSGNLYDMCSYQAKSSTGLQNSNQDETNQESLKGTGDMLVPTKIFALSLAVLLIRI
ncbi:neuritin 1-like a [Erpetoichthys calabaricus]|uniref:Neuritin 1 like n=1 Tax=Erpetoichthys calabaricus TaxID=27687 RepID=A0A8C4S566_ERPCA|nr:neuritin 1-like a [Erpetoichthys calabaricus]